MHRDDNLDVTLSAREILLLHAAAVNAGLPARRSTLLAGIDPTLRASLPDDSVPAAQCLSDIHALARAGVVREVGKSTGGPSLPRPGWTNLGPGFVTRRTKT